MATARALSLGVLLALALCLTVCVARQPTDKPISYAAPRGSAGNGCRSFGSAIFGKTKRCPGQPPMMAAAKTEAAESKGAYISHDALSADKYPYPRKSGAKTEGKYPTPTMTGAKTAAAGPEGVYMSPAALSEEKRRYISYAALKNDKPHGKCSSPSCL